MKILMKKNFIIISLILVLLVILVISVIDRSADPKMTPQQIIEYDIKQNQTPNFTGAIKESILTLKIDRLPVYFYLDEINVVDVTFFNGGLHEARTTIGVPNSIIEKNDYSTHFDNKNGNRIVWGIVTEDKKNKVMVDEYAAKTVTLNYSINGENNKMYFWYVLLKGKPDYIIQGLTD